MTILYIHVAKHLCNIKEDLICTMKNILVKFLKANPAKFQFMILDDKTYYGYILKINFNLTCV